MREIRSSGSVEGVMGNHDPYSDCHVRGFPRVVFSLSSFSLVLIAPCGRGGVPEHPGERTRAGGTEPARPPPPPVIQVSACKDGAVHPPWTPRNRPRAARAGAWTPSAAACQAAARSLPPTVGTRPAGWGSRGGSAPRRLGTAHS